MSDNENRFLNSVFNKVRQYVESHPQFKKVFANTAWLFGDKLLRMAVGVFVGVWVARYLGPERFGRFNYVVAFIALFTSLGSLGLNNIIVRDLVRCGSKAGGILGSSFILQLIGGVSALVLAIVIALLVRRDDTSLAVMVAIAGATMLFKPVDVIRCWFESKVQVKYVIFAETTSFLFFSLVKILLVLDESPLVYFVWIFLGEIALYAVFLSIVYFRVQREKIVWAFDRSLSIQLLSDSWPLVLSGVASMLYMRIDQLMLGEMMGDDAVGLYSAAVRLSELWYFIPMAVVSSVFPSIVEARSSCVDLYKKRLIQLFKLMTLMSLMLAVPISFMSDWIVQKLYGEGYSSSGVILLIHIWSGVFVFSGVASSRWFISENLQRFTFYRTLAGCLVSVALNYYLIPVYGVVGSAFASVVSQATASFLFNAFSFQTRPLFKMQFEGFFGKALTSIVFR